MEIDKTATGRMELYSRFRIGQTPARAAASHSAQAQNADASRFPSPMKPCCAPRHIVPP